MATTYSDEEDTLSSVTSNIQLVSNILFTTYTQCSTVHATWWEMMEPKPKQAITKAGVWFQEADKMEGNIN